MRTVLLVALALMGAAAWAAEETEPTDVERLEQLVNVVAAKATPATKKTQGGFLGPSGSKLDASRRRQARKTADEAADSDQTLEQDIIEMRHMARLVQEKAMRLGVKDVNLTRCVNAISDAYGGKRKQIQMSRGALGPAAAVKQLRQQLKRIKEADAHPDKPAPDIQAQQAKPQELDAQQLADMLWEKRKGILKADTSVDGLAPATVAAYLKTLTTSQHELFASLRGKYLDRGFTPADADATALRELHGQLKEHPGNHNRKEVEAILKRLGAL